MTTDAVLTAIADEVVNRLFYYRDTPPPVIKYTRTDDTCEMHAGDDLLYRVFIGDDGDIITDYAVSEEALDAISAALSDISEFVGPVHIPGW